jgi:hypothetical protein
MLELYVSNGRTAPKPLLPNEIDDEEENKDEEILQSEYRYGTLCYCLKYKGYLAEQSK